MLDADAVMVGVTRQTDAVNRSGGGAGNDIKWVVMPARKDFMDGLENTYLISCPRTATR